MERLSCLKQGEYAVLCELPLEESFRTRIGDLGMLPGSTVRCAHIAPSGSPMAFDVKGSIIALRKSTCDSIMIKRDADVPCETP